MSKEGDGDQLGLVLRNHSKDRLAQHNQQPEPEVIKKFSGELKQVEDDVARAPVEELAKARHSDVNKGLTSAKAKERLAIDGLNELKQPPVPGFFKLFLMQLLNFVIILLIIAATMSLIVAATSKARDDILSYITGIAIFVLIIINAAIAAKTEAQANGALDALAKLGQPSVMACRDGLEVKVPSNQLVIGDIVLLMTGDYVPADVRFIEAVDFKVNEMPLTGEPDDVSKTHKVKPFDPRATQKLVPETMGFSGCLVTNGKARCIVVDTGMNTRIGKIAAMLQQSGDSKKGGMCSCLPDTTSNRTPLQENVDKLGARIGILAIGICVFVFIIGVIMKTVPPDYDPEDDKTIASIIYMILISVTLAVAAIPEGIPLCVTISLSIGCSNMVKEMVRVRKLAAVETLGSASVICTDKTGTLTEGKMTMVNIWTAGRKYNVTGKGFNPEDGTIKRVDGDQDGTKDAAVRSSLFAALLCCNTKLKKTTDANGNAAWEPQGNSSEAPIVVAAQKIGFKGDDVEKECERVVEVPFSSSRKMMLTVSKLSGTTLGAGGVAIDGSPKLAAVCKGAPNFVLDACVSWLSEDGSFKPLTGEKKAELLGYVDEFSSQALRVLAIGVNFMSDLPFDVNDEDVDINTKFTSCRDPLRFLGLVASIDPERKGVPEAVLTARGASIRVVMITGDYLKTAIAIGHNCNILLSEDNDDEDAVDCGTLRPGGKYLTNNELDQITSRVKVFARAQPEDKLEIVKSLQRQDYVAAMTGDGVNDAPALNRADIGVAMGIQGTEVAKGAADMVLMDDNFSNIVVAVEKGRVIYSGIQKFVAFIMSVHIAEVIQIFTCVVASLPIMRTPLQILFLILVTDLPPSIALGVEPGEAGILKKRPRPKQEPIILSWMWQSTCMNGAILSAVIVTIYILALNYYLDGAIRNDDIAALRVIKGDDFVDDNLANARTTAFISLVYSENIRAYISRSFNRPVWSQLCANMTMLYAVVLAQLALYIAVLVPYLSESILKLNGRSIGAWGWGVAFLGPLSTLVLCEVYKVVTHFQMESYQKRLESQRQIMEEQRRHQIGIELMMKQNENLLKQNGTLIEQIATANAEIKALQGKLKESESQSPERSAADLWV